MRHVFIRSATIIGSASHSKTIIFNVAEFGTFTPRIHDAIAREHADLGIAWGRAIGPAPRLPAGGACTVRELDGRCDIGGVYG